MSIALIAPYPELAHLSRLLCQEMNLPVAVYSGNMEDGLRVAREVAERGVELIISRGVTAELIRRELDRPVVNISVSAFDVLQSLKPYEGNRHVGVIGHEDIVRKARYVNDFLGLNLAFFGNATLQNIDRVVTEACERGVEVIVGDATAYESARQHGLEARIVYSGADSVVNALQYAVATHDHLLQTVTSANMLQTVLDAMDGGALVASPDGQILNGNTAARNMFPLLQRPKPPTMDALFPSIDWRSVAGGGRDRLQDIVSTPKGLISISIQPHVLAGKIEHLICTFHDVNQIKQLENSLRRKGAQSSLLARYTFADIVHGSAVMTKSIRMARKFAETESCILLTGETGTGKELFAQGIHNHGSRAQNNFVAINCGSLSEDLLESELFGYEEGAFTGALKGGKMGVFELAHKGTLFLDEINAASPKLQTRLLRTLQEREIRRVGGTTVLPVNVRVIAASNAALDEEVAAGNFREDLFFRLSVLDVHIPSLRERENDVVLLFRQFVKGHCANLGLPVPKITERTKKRLLDYHWPGNVRELRNFAEKYVVLYPDDIVPDLFRGRRNVPDQGAPAGTLDAITRNAVRMVYEEEGSMQLAARRLGISRNTLRTKLKPDLQREQAG